MHTIAEIVAHIFSHKMNKETPIPSYN